MAGQMKQIILILCICTSFSMFAMDALQKRGKRFLQSIGWKTDKPFSQWAELPPELKTIIISAGVLQAKTLQEAVDQIKTQAQVNKLFREIIKKESAKLINYLANKSHVSGYKIAFALGVLSKEWFINKGLIKEGDKLDQAKLQLLVASWRKAGKALIENVKLRNNQEVTRLLKERTDPNIQDKYGKTALYYYASLEVDKDMVKLLLELGADPNIQNEEGRTALHHASLMGHKEIVALLLDKGADPNIQNEHGGTALRYASANGHKDIVQMLKKAIGKWRGK